MSNYLLKDEVKKFFESGSIPTQEQFEKLIDATSNATLIDSGTIDNSHLPSYIRVTHLEASSNVSANALMVKNANIDVNLSVSNVTALNGQITVEGNLDVSKDITASGITLSAGSPQSPLENAVLKNDRGSEGILDLLTFNEERGFVTIPVKIDEGFMQDEIAAKAWVTGEVIKVSNRLTAEVTQSSGAAEQLQNSLIAESDSRQGADSQLQGSINSQYERITIETQRATSAEGLLQESIDGQQNRLDAIEQNGNIGNESIEGIQEDITVLETELSSTNSQVYIEKERASLAEFQLQQSINSQQSKINNILAATGADKDSFAEIVELINSVDTESDAAFSTYVTSNNIALQALTDQLNPLASGIKVGGSIEIGKEDVSSLINLTRDVYVSQQLRVEGVVTPSVGNSSSNGICFPGDPGGGDGDSAWIRYYSNLDENTLLEIGTLNDTENHIVLNASGNVGVGDFVPTAKFHVDGVALANAWNIASDKRLKSEINVIQDPLERISAINGVTFNWKDEQRHSEFGEQIGVIAQDVEQVFPEIVSINKDGYKSVDYSKLVAPLIESVKQLNKKVQNQQLLIQCLLNSNN